jgi:lipid A 3-O-deacylase
VGYWSGDGAGGVDLWEIGVTPVFRYQGRAKNAHPYVEAAVGAHLLSRTHIDNARDFGSSFQFGDHIGLGAVFGEGDRYDLGYRFQHLSNGSLQEPNDGIIFHQLRFAYRF